MFVAYAKLAQYRQCQADMKTLKQWEDGTLEQKLKGKNFSNSNTKTKREN